MGGPSLPWERGGSPQARRSEVAPKRAPQGPTPHQPPPLTDPAHRAILPGGAGVDAGWRTPFLPVERMAERLLVLGNKNYSSWSLRGWIGLTMAGIEFTEQVIYLETGRIVRHSDRHAGRARESRRSLAST